MWAQFVLILNASGLCKFIAIPNPLKGGWVSFYYFDFTTENYEAGHYFFLSLMPFFAFTQVPTYVSGEGEGRVSCNYSDKFLTTQQFNVTGKSIVLNLSAPMVLYFSGQGELSFCVVLPGDSVVYNREKGVGTIHAKKTHTAGFTRVLNDKGLNMFGPPDFMGLDWNKAVNFRVLLDEFYALRSKRMSLLANEKPSMAREGNGYIWYAREIDLAYARTLLMPMSVKLSKKENFDVNVLPQFYRDSIEVVFRRLANQDDALEGSYSYRAFVTQYNKYRSVLSSSLLARDQFETARVIWTGATREFVLFSIVNGLQKESASDFRQMRDLFAETKPDAAYISHLDATQNATKLNRAEIASDQELLNTELKSYDGEKVKWKELLRKYNGKYIYADMWASWCVPCIQEIPNSISLARRFEGRDIAMIYISIDSNEEKWKRVAIRFGKEHNSLQFRLDPKSRLAKILTDGAVPRYILFNRDGKVANLDAPRPGASSAASYLEKMITK